MLKTSCLAVCWFLLIPIFLIGQSSEEAKINISKKVITVQEALDAIKQQTQVIVSYPTDRIDLDKLILLRGKFFKLKDFVNTVFVDQNLKPVYKSDHKIVLVYDQYNGLKQSLRMLSGVVRDLSDGEPLIGAHIYDKYGMHGTYTNEFGLFQLQAPPSLDSIQVSYLGYESKVLPCNKMIKQTMQINLNGSLELSQVTIESSKEEGFDIRLNGNHHITANNFLQSFSTVGDIDPMMSILKLASVQSGHEADGSAYVRGGSPDQNLIFMDGVPLYETTHILGVASIFNNDAVKSVEIYKHAFPSKFGGRLSSVIDFKMDEGDKFEHGGTVSLSPFHAKIHLEGPISNGRTSYNVSYRRSLVNLFFDNALQEVLDFQETDISYFDFNAKVSHEIDSGNKIFMSLYSGNDDVTLVRNELLEREDSEDIFEISNTDNVNWGNKIASLQWQKIVNPKSYIKFNMFYSDYSTDSRSQNEFKLTERDSIGESSLDILASSRIQDAGVNAEFNHFASNKMRILAGTGILYHNYTPTLRQRTEILNEDPEGESFESIRADEYFLFGDIQYNFSESLLLQAGLRFSQFLVRNRSYNNLEPRLSLTKQFGNGKHSASLSLTKMSQYVHLLVNPGIGLPSDLWLPSTDLLPPETAWQYSFSSNFSLWPGWKFGFDAYYKNMSNVVDYSSPFDLFYNFLNENNIEENFVRSGDWENFVNVGNSTSKGLEFSLTKSVGNFQALGSYSWSKTDRLFPNLNEGLPFPYKYDRIHDWSVTMSYKFNDSWSFNSNWVYGTGEAFSLARETYEDIGGMRLLQSDGRNNIRFRSFHRLDLGLKYVKDINEKNKLSIDFGVYNVYNRKNTFYVYVFENPLTGNIEPREVSVFPTLPHFNVHLSF